LVIIALLKKYKTYSLDATTLLAAEYAEEDAEGEE
jgi:hypothetical protein